MRLRKTTRNRKNNTRGLGLKIKGLSLIRNQYILNIHDKKEREKTLYREEIEPHLQ